MKLYNVYLPSFLSSLFYLIPLKKQVSQNVLLYSPQNGYNYLNCLSKWLATNQLHCVDIKICCHTNLRILSYRFAYCITLFCLFYHLDLSMLIDLPICLLLYLHFLTNKTTYKELFGCLRIGLCNAYSSWPLYFGGP